MSTHLISAAQLINAMLRVAPDHTRFLGRLAREVAGGALDLEGFCSSVRAHARPTLLLEAILSITFQRTTPEEIKAMYLHCTECETGCDHPGCATLGMKLRDMRNIADLRCEECPQATPVPNLDESLSRPNKIVTAISIVPVATPVEEGSATTYSSAPPEPPADLPPAAVAEAVPAQPASRPGPIIGKKGKGRANKDGHAKAVADAKRAIARSERIQPGRDAHSRAMAEPGARALIALARARCTLTELSPQSSPANSPSNSPRNSPLPDRKRHKTQVSARPSSLVSDRLPPGVAEGLAEAMAEA